jgi:peptidoglycan hydrolase-like amidase
MAKAYSFIVRPWGLWLACAVIVLAASALGICQDVEAKRAPLKGTLKAMGTAPVTPVARPPNAVDCYPYPPNMVYPVRIGIATKVGAAHFAVWQPGAVFVDNVPIFSLKPGVVYTITPGRLTEYASGASLALPLDKRAQISSRDYQVWAQNRWYRGTLEIVPLGGRVTVINFLDLENYLMGVVPSEMPSGWPLEALKAQAVAARSYATAHLGNLSKWSKSEGYDLVPDVRDQAYKGRAAEAATTNLAIARTQGIILKDSGKVKAGFYRAWVGDSEENLNIRRTAVPTTTLEKLTGVTGIIGVTVKRWDSNMNAHDIQVMGKKTTKEVYGIELARRLNFTTAGILDVSQSGDGRSWTFTYRGPGNGVRGLSQHGARMLAANGWNFEQILRQYYQDTDGKLRLDFMDKYHAATFRPARHKVQATSDDDE